MEKLTAHRQAIKRLMTEHADRGNRCSPVGEDHFLAFDEVRDTYVLTKAAWINGRRLHGNTFFVRIAGGKIWVEEDRSEEGIAYELVAAGIPREDIVLGFQPPRARPQTEFAVA